MPTHTVSRIRKPVKRLGAERYLVLTLLSFALSVIMVRVFLSLSGYPQLGGGQLHVAHVLWGGLLLFVASVLPLILANRWVYIATALLSGVGVGLFIDEVGKFITSSNDYFYPAAAPIIYAFFLLTVLLYVRVSRPWPGDARTELYRALDSLEEVLDHDLDPRERAELETRLLAVTQQARHPDIAQLADALLRVVRSDATYLAPEVRTFWVRWTGRLRAFEDRHISQVRLRLATAIGLAIIGMLALSNLAAVIGVALAPSDLRRTAAGQLAAEYARIEISGGRTLVLLLAWLVLQGLVGLAMVVAAGLLVAGRSRAGTAIGYTSLLLALTTVNLLLFYFHQFVATAGVIVQFGLLQAVAMYRRRFLISPPDRGGTERPSTESA